MSLLATATSPNKVLPDSYLNVSLHVASARPRRIGYVVTAVVTTTSVLRPPPPRLSRTTAPVLPTF